MLWYISVCRPAHVDYLAAVHNYLQILMVVESEESSLMVGRLKKFFWKADHSFGPLALQVVPDACILCPICLLFVGWSTVTFKLVGMCSFISMYCVCDFILCFLICSKWCLKDTDKKNSWTPVRVHFYWDSSWLRPTVEPPEGVSWYRNFTQWGYIESLDSEDDIYFYACELVNDIGLQGSWKSKFEQLNQLLEDGRFVEVHVVRNHRGEKAAAPMQLLPSGFEGEAEMAEALNAQRFQKASEWRSKQPVISSFHEGEESEKRAMTMMRIGQVQMGAMSGSCRMQWLTSKQRLIVYGNHPLNLPSGIWSILLSGWVGNLGIHVMLGRVWVVADGQFLEKPKPLLRAFLESLLGTTTGLPIPTPKRFGRFCRSTHLMISNGLPRTWWKALKPQMRFAIGVFNHELLERITMRMDHGIANPASCLGKVLAREGCQTKAGWTSPRKENSKAARLERGRKPKAGNPNHDCQVTARWT